MKTITGALQTHLDGEVTTLATCWKITRTDNQVFTFTDHTDDIPFDGDIYEASTGFTPTQIEGNDRLAVDNLDVIGLISQDGIDRDDLLAGDYNHAEIEIFQLNYADTSQGRLKLRRGWLGEVQIKQGQFIAEVRGLTQRLQQRIGESYSTLCRADLGDARCMVNLALFTVTGSITSLVNSRTFRDSTRTEADDVFNYGLLTFTSGDNTGRSMEVKDYTQTGGEIELYAELGRPLQVGDAYEVYQGCDKRLTTCINKFNNVDNFRGEPYVPGIDRVAQYPG